MQTVFGDPRKDFPALITIVFLIHVVIPLLYLWSLT